jgi:hypothetical protein
MQLAEAQQIVATLRRARPRLRYFAHRYAAWLLARAAGEGTSTRALKGSGHGRHLQNLLVQRVAARAGDGVLTRDALEAAEPNGAEVYRIGLTTWGPRRGVGWHQGYYQTSRPGTNVVLLLNFSRRHNAAYRRCLDPERKLPTVFDLHPHAPAPDLTLAWARLDLDMARGEALVEEIQSDWIRDVAELWSIVSQLPEERRDRAVQRYFRSSAVRFEGLAHYWNHVLAHHRAWWSEATLFAALWLLFEHLRVRRIYYHTYEGGTLRKGMWCEPPRSLYTDLPRRFGFELTPEPPRFLERPKKRRSSCGRGAADLPWYRLEL